MRILLFLFTFFLSDIAFSQEVTIESVRNKDVYDFVTNVYKITACNYDCNDLIVEVENARIYKFENDYEGECLYDITPKTRGKVGIKVYNKEGKLLSSDFFINRFIPNLKASIGKSKNQYFYTKSELLAHNKIMAYIESFDINRSFLVTGSKYKIIRNGKVISEGNFISDNFSIDFCSKLPLLNDFDEILFYDIEVKLESNITPMILQPFKIIILNNEVTDFVSSVFYSYPIDNYYWKDSNTNNQIQYWLNDKVKTQYIDFKPKEKQRLDYDDSGNLIRQCVINQNFQNDTLILFDPETYDERFTISFGYCDILNGPITEYFPYKAEKIMRLQGQYKDNLKTGIWKACKETAPDKYECYQAEFKDDVMVGEIKKI